MPEKIRFGLIGCGSQGRYLSDSLHMSGRAELVACTDINPEAASLAREECGYAEVCATTAELVARADIDAVIVATVHDQLQPCALAAVEADKHVFVEKPMALGAADGRALVKAARDAGTKLMVGYALRFGPERLRMKSLLDQGLVGEPAHILAGQIIGSMGAGWLAESAHGGGPLLYIGSHVIDQVLWVAGRPAERVYAEVDWASEGGVDQQVLLTIRFGGGLVAQVCTSQRMGGRYGWIDVVGSAGRIRSEWESLKLYVESRALKSYRTPAWVEVPVDAHHPPLLPGARMKANAYRYARAWAAELVEFIQAIQEDRDPSVTGEEAVQVLEIMDAALESGRTGQAINI